MKKTENVCTGLFWQWLIADEKSFLNWKALAETNTIQDLALLLKKYVLNEVCHIFGTCLSTSNCLLIDLLLFSVDEINFIEIAEKLKK